MISFICLLLAPLLQSLPIPPMEVEAGGMIAIEMLMTAEIEVANISDTQVIQAMKIIDMPMLSNP